MHPSALCGLILHRGAHLHVRTLTSRPARLLLLLLLPLLLLPARQHLLLQIQQLQEQMKEMREQACLYMRKVAVPLGKVRRATQYDARRRWPYEEGAAI